MPVILVAHGNAGHIGHRSAKFAPLALAGYGLFLLEYRGFGGNPGSPTEEGLNEDGRAAFAWLEGHGIASQRIVLYGESLGTGVAVRLADEHDTAALVLEAPFTSIGAVAARHYWYVPFASHLVLDRFDAASRIARIDEPVLMVAGGRDDVVPPELSRALYEQASEPKELWIAPEAGHNDLYEHGAAEAVAGFLARVVPSRND
jgi:hypothetical protein